MKLGAESETEGVETLLVDSSALGKILGIGRSTVFKLSSAGRLPRPLRIGRATRWSVADVRLWIAFGCPSREQFELLQDEMKS